ncbi:hypothetical protein EXS56_00920 [Candidatus Kaiserbacteria bacterium]|nr:hypothetical protein [Candidatus Kaiserbacteria bacterium]
MNRIYKKARLFVAHSRAKLAGYYPNFPVASEEVLFAEIAAFFSISIEEVKSAWGEYQKLQPRQYGEKYGGEWEKKHLCTEEAFLLFMLLKKFPVKNIVEIGTQYGKSTRRIIDMKNQLGVTAPIVCYDIVDNVKHFSPEEAELRLKDLTDTFKQEVLDRLPPGLIYLDAHPYGLLEEVLGETIKDGRWVIAVHDCGLGLCNPKMTIPKSVYEYITSRTGLWERYVLADLFHFKKAEDPKMDDCANDTHRMHIFSTLHGLAVLVPRTLSSSA